MDICSVILAGGFGTRLAPLSTREKPKQFHDLTNSGKSLLQECYARAQSISNRQTLIIGSQLHKSLISEQLTNKPHHVILEKEAKNTALSVFLAAQAASKSMLVIMPADHKISGDFSGDVLRAIKVAKTGRIVTFGIAPSEPTENFGYIVTHHFTEKPNRDIAEKLIAQNAKWNSGIFIARADVLLGEFKKFHPEFFKDNFADLPSLPFDKAIMEKTSRHVCLAASFEWDDLGSWESVARHNPNLALEMAA